MAVEIKKITFNLPPVCTDCKEMASCRKIIVLREIIEKLKRTFPESEVGLEFASIDILYGLLGRDELLKLEYWQTIVSEIDEEERISIHIPREEDEIYIGEKQTQKDVCQIYQ